MSLTITIYGKPVPASRPRVFKSGGRAYTKTHTEYANLIKPILAANKPSETIDKLIKVEMEFVFQKYKGSDYPTYRADLDNLAKIPLDEMTKLNYWTDDSLVSELILTKRFVNDNEAPHTKLTISTK